MSPRTPQIRALCNLSLLLCCCMVSLVLAQSYDYGFNVAKAFNVKRQLEGDLIITTGVPVTGKIVPTRPEIRDLQQDPDKWSLYVLALDMMQYTIQTDPTSWFSITGTLHSTPAIFSHWIVSKFRSQADFLVLSQRYSWRAFSAVEQCPTNTW